MNITYGYPSEEMFEQAARNEAALGDCMQAMDDPDRRCLDCGHQWEVVRRKLKQVVPTIQEVDSL